MPQDRDLLGKVRVGQVNCLSVFWTVVLLGESLSKSEGIFVSYCQDLVHSFALINIFELRLQLSDAIEFGLFRGLGHLVEDYENRLVVYHFLIHILFGVGGEFDDLRHVLVHFALVADEDHVGDAQDKVEYAPVELVVAGLGTLDALGVQN